MILVVPSTLSPENALTTRFSLWSRSNSRVPGAAWRIPTIAVTIPLFLMKSICRWKVECESLSNPTIKPPITSKPARCIGAGRKGSQNGRWKGGQGWMSAYLSVSGPAAHGGEIEFDQRGKRLIYKAPCLGQLRLWFRTGWEIGKKFSHPGARKPSLQTRIEPKTSTAAIVIQSIGIKAIEVKEFRLREEGKKKLRRRTGGTLWTGQTGSLFHRSKWLTF